MVVCDPSLLFSAVHQWIKTLGLGTVYETNTDGRSSARKLMALVLLPLNQVELGFDDIVEEAPDSIDDLIDYFRDHWIKKMTLSLWNVVDLDVRTNNHVECRQSSLFGLHEIFWREAFFLLSFRLEQSFQQAHEQDSSQHVGIHRLLARRRNHLLTTISQAQGSRAKENGTEDIGDAETNRQFRHSLLQRQHRPRWASWGTLTTGGFKEINFL